MGVQGNKPASPCHHISITTMQQGFWSCSRIDFPFSSFTKGHEDPSLQEKGRVIISQNTSTIFKRTVFHFFLSPNLSLFMHTRNWWFAFMETPTNWPAFVYLLMCLHLQSLLYNLAQHVLHVRPGTKYQVLRILLSKMCIWENGNLPCIFSLCFSMFVYNSLAVQLHFKNSTLWGAFFTPNIFLLIFWFPGWVGSHYSFEEGTEACQCEPWLWT